VKKQNSDLSQSCTSQQGTGLKLLVSFADKLTRRQDKDADTDILRQHADADGNAMLAPGLME
jgi:hypothetical protein